jgi:catechol 2,3-dioxygenase-like lactoylglutathione lyase family enzyme
MKLTGIHHSSIVVTDMSRARRFYAELLGLPEVQRPANFVTPVVWFEVGDEQIHLIPSDHADSESPRHVALHVEDARAAREHFRSRGVPIEETTPLAGADRFFIQDPDGNKVEMIQIDPTFDGPVQPRQFRRQSP